MPVELHPHQQEAVDKMHNGCVLYGGVGVGKSITAMAYFVSRVCKGTYDDRGSMRTPKDIYIITTAKKRDSADWEKEAIAFGISTDRAASIPGIKLTVDSWNNLKHYVGVTDAFFVFDEQRVVGYGAWSRAFIKIARHNEWILLSATPGDTWLDYIPVFIANGWYKHKTDFLDQHVIWTPRVKYPKVLRYQNVSVLVRRRNQVLVHMPYERHTTRHPVDIWCDYDEVAFEKAVKKRWHVFENRPLRDVSELFSVMRKVVNSDESRTQAVRQLLSQHPKLIVFYNFDYELEMLRELGDQLVQEPQSKNSTSESESSKLEMLRNLGESLSMDSTSPNTASMPSVEGSSSGRLDPESESVRQSSTTDTSSQHELPSRSKSSRSSSADSSTSSSMISNDTGSNTSSSFAFAEWNGHKHQEIPETDRWLYAVQYRAGAEGWNCVETDAMCFFSQTYSYRDWWQAHGRIDRINTPFEDLWYYHLVSRSVIDKAIRKALKAKKSFNERDLAL